MAIRISIGTPYSSAGAINSATRDDPGEISVWAQILPAPTDPSRTTPRSPAPLSFKKPRRSSTFDGARGDTSGGEPVHSEHIPPPHSAVLQSLLVTLCILSYEHYTEAHERQSKVCLHQFPFGQHLRQNNPLHTT